MNWNELGKKALPHILSVAAIVILNLVLFMPQYQGKRLSQGDISQGQAMAGEIREYEKNTGEEYYWNNSMFGGMPWDLLVYGRDKNVVRTLKPATRFWQKGYISMYLAMGLLTYLSLVLLGMRPWLAVLGASVMILNVNHMVLLEAGHNNKIRAIVYFPLIASGVMIALSKGSLWKQLFGAVLAGCGISLAISENHPQMLYYFLFFVGIWVLFRFVAGYKDLKSQTLRGLGLLLVLAILGVASNMTQIQSTLGMSKNTMRGAPILTENKVQGSSSNVEGLAWDYAMQWSNAPRDVYSLLVPRAVGGSSGEEIPTTTEVGRLLKQNRSPVGKDGNVRAPLYWGELPFTSGPYYIGALVFFLFVLSFFVLPIPQRIGFGLMFLMLVVMSLGKNAEGINRFLFDNLPYFNKFRAPNSVLHATAYLLILPALLGVHEFLKRGSKIDLQKTLFPAVGIVGGICLLLALFGGVFFDFQSSSDAQRYAQNPGFLDLLIEDRQSLLRKDAFRSLMIVLIAAGLLWAFAKKHIKSTQYVVLGLVLVSVFDLYSVSRRYLDEDNWIKKRPLESIFPEREVDRQIKSLEGGKRYKYRVLDLSINTFNTASTSLYHNTIGGYNAAKPQRIQDIIDRYIGRGQPNMGVLNMLNAKYFIQANGQMQVNNGALGNAWFVNSIKTVNTPKEEIESLATLDPRQMAVVQDGEFGDKIEGLSPSGIQGDIRISEYTPDRIVYQSQSNKEGLAVFSEAWYPFGWSATIDGAPADILRANYTLRALRIPSGSHEIVFSFQPQVKSAGLTLLSSSLLLLLLLGSSYLYGKEAFQAAKEQKEKERQKKSIKSKSSVGKKKKKK